MHAWTRTILLVVAVLIQSIYYGATEDDHHDDHDEGNGTVYAAEHMKKRAELIDKLFLNYDPRIAPNFDQHGPTRVAVQIFVLSIDTISETNMDFAMGMFLRQSWNDSRFEYEPIEGMRALELDQNLMAKVWIPDLFMPNEKKAHVHQVTVPNKLMHIYPEGKIEYSQRISATLKCNFDLRKFPLDTQTCIVQMESYGYTTDTLVFIWNKLAIDTVKGMRIPQFELQEISTARCDKIYFNVGYTCVEISIKMIREKSYYVTQVYIPSYLIVFLSWVSFWLDIDAVPARISLGLLTVLTMTTQSSGVRATLPKVSYVKGIDVWMAMCLLFVFMALVQFAYVNVLSRVQKRRRVAKTCVAAVDSMVQGIVAKPSNGINAKTDVKNTDEKHGDVLKTDDNANGEAGDATATDTVKAKPSFLKMVNKMNLPKAEPTSEPSSPEVDVERNSPEESLDQKKARFPMLLNPGKKFNINALLSADREKARNVDRMSRVLFPVAFFIFNLIYWCTYVFWEPTDQP